jgi:hypothetical protein
MPTPYPRIAVMLLPLVLAVAPAPAGSQRAGCGIVIASSDPERQASFERFDRVQSPTDRKDLRAVPQQRSGDLTR